MFGPLGFARILLLDGHVRGGAGSVAGVAPWVSLGCGFVLLGTPSLQGGRCVAPLPQHPSLPPARVVSRGASAERAEELRERPRAAAGQQSPPFPTVVCCRDLLLSV